MTLCGGIIKTKYRAMKGNQSGLALARMSPWCPCKHPPHSIVAIQLKSSNLNSLKTVRCETELMSTLATSATLIVEIFFIKVLLRRKFLFLFPSFFNINLLYMFKIIQIAKNWNDTCVRGLEISHWKVRKYRPPLQSSQSNSPRDLRKAVVRLTTWFMHCDVETSTKRFAFGKSLWV